MYIIFPKHVREKIYCKMMKYPYPMTMASHGHNAFQNYVRKPEPQKDREKQTFELFSCS